MLASQHRMAEAKQAGVAWLKQGFRAFPRGGRIRRSDAHVDGFVGIDPAEASEALRPDEVNDLLEVNVIGLRHQGDRPWWLPGTFRHARNVRNLLGRPKSEREVRLPFAGPAYLSASVPLGKPSSFSTSAGGPAVLFGLADA